MTRFPCTIMRGGTSKAIFFLEEDMPKDRDLWEEFLLDVMGSPDKRQIDGLGGANSLTSKVAIIGKSKDKDIDVNYTFAQVSLTDMKVAFNSNCGNISSAVGPYAVIKQLVDARDKKSKVRIFNVNTDKLIEAEVETENGQYNPDGDCMIPGVPGTGSRELVTFFGPEGASTGRLLPTGKSSEIIETSIGKIEISIVDAATTLVYINAEDIGLAGTELHYEFTQEKLDLLEEIRCIAAERCGFCSREEATKKTPAVPKTTLVSRPKDYKDLDGRLYKEESMDMVIRMMSMQKPHQALAITGAVCTTVAAMIPGSLVYKIIEKRLVKNEAGQNYSKTKESILRLGHPGGVMDTISGKTAGDEVFVKVERTARCIMDGYVFTKNDY